MVTIADVAAHAGVGAGTVSRVLNDSPRVSESTRARVLAAIEALDYRPNPLARGLSPRPVPDPRRRRAVLHPRLGRRAAPRRGRRPRRQPLRPRAVQRRVAGAPRRALRHADPARPGRRAARHVAAAAGHQPRAARRVGRAGGAARRPRRRRPRRRHRRRRGRPHRHPPPARRSATAHRLPRRRPRQPARLHRRAPRREQGYRETMAEAGLAVEPDDVRHGPHVRDGRPRAAPSSCSSCARPAHRRVRRLRHAGPRRPRGGPGRRPGACPATCRSSASTTSRCRATRASPPSASRCSRAAASAAELLLEALGGRGARSASPSTSLDSSSWCGRRPHRPRLQTPPGEVPGTTATTSDPNQHPRGEDQ